jgi:CheY-like chemotaxis protein
MLDAAVRVDEAGADKYHHHRQQKTELRAVNKRQEKLLSAPSGIVEESEIDFHTTPKILIVEDNAFVLSFLEVLMGELYPDHIILCAPNGGDGIECALMYIPNLIVLDRTLPDISGEVFYEKLRKQDALRETPVLVISGSPPTSAEWAAHFASGPVHFLKKPFTAENLRSAVKTLMPEVPRREPTTLP